MFWPLLSLPMSLLLLMLLLLQLQLSTARILLADSSDHPLDRTDRVVGGTEVSKDSVKWVASLQYRDMRMHFCGATVISDYWVLTAAHCMQNTNKDKFVVVTGGTDLNSGNLQVRLPAKVIMADYDEHIFANDLALIKTKTPLEPSTRESGAFLQLTEQSPAAGTSCLVLGWGVTSQGGSTVRRLQHAVVTTQTNELCQQEFSVHDYTISETMLCAGDSGRDACQGDSGGPLVCRADGGSVRGASAAQLRLVGAVSWGVGCATPGLPGVYADVGSMIDWVRRTMEEN